MKYIPIVFIFIFMFLSLDVSPHEHTNFIPKKSKKNGYVEPFQMFDNVFYVGDKWTSSYLVKTTNGLVLVETLESPYGRWIPANIKKLGYNPDNIEYIIVSHGHSDHVGSAEYIQRKHGGNVVMSREEYLLAQEQSKKSKGKGFFKAPKVDLFIGDGDKLVVGDTEFLFYVTPGHSEGCLSVEFKVKNAGKWYRAFMVGGHSPPAAENAKGVISFIESMQRIRTLASTEPKVSINLANHPHKNNLFKKQALGKRNLSLNHFIDSNGFFEFIEKQEKLGFDILAKQEENAHKSIRSSILKK